MRTPTTKDCACEFCGFKGAVETQGDNEHGAVCVCPDCGVICFLDYKEGVGGMLNEEQIKVLPPNIKEGVLEHSIPIVLKWIMENTSHPMASHLKLAMVGKLPKNNPKNS